MLFLNVLSTFETSCIGFTNAKETFNIVVLQTLWELSFRKNAPSTTFPVSSGTLGPCSQKIKVVRFTRVSLLNVYENTNHREELKSSHELKSPNIIL